MKQFFLGLLLGLAIFIGIGAFYVFTKPDTSVEAWRQETGYKGDICFVAYDKKQGLHCLNGVSYTKQLLTLGKDMIFGQPVRSSLALTFAVGTEMSRNKQRCVKCGDVATACHISARWVYCSPCLEDYLNYRAEMAMKILNALDQVLDADLAYQNKRIETCLGKEKQ